LIPTGFPLLLAVLEKRMGYTLHRSDVFVAVTGALNSSSPASILRSFFRSRPHFANAPSILKLSSWERVGLGGRSAQHLTRRNPPQRSAQYGFSAVRASQTELEKDFRLKA